MADLLQRAHQAGSDAVADVEWTCDEPEALIASIADAAVEVLVRDLDAMLFPERYPGHDPEHLYWEDHDPAEDNAGDPFQWSADIPEWVADWIVQRRREMKAGPNASREGV